MNRRFFQQPARKITEGWITPSLFCAFVQSGLTAHRIHSAAEAWIERFGNDLLLSYKTEAGRDAALAGLPAWTEAAEFSPRRIFGRYLPEKNEERGAPLLLEGDPEAPLNTVVEENGMRFGVSFDAGYSAGLFIDQRANRALLRKARVKRLLNTFAYTCSFSVAAALSGAGTVSIDLSRKSLDRGSENFALNGLDSSPSGQHRFLADDVMTALPRLARKGERFDAIILDPPTFSRGHKGRRFQVEDDFEALLLAAMEVATDRARILLSTNCTRLTRRALENIARFCLKATRRAADFHTEPELPDVPASAAAQTVWVLLK